MFVSLVVDPLCGSLLRLLFESARPVEAAWRVAIQVCCVGPSRGVKPSEKNDSSDFNWPFDRLVHLRLIENNVRASDNLFIFWILEFVAEFDFLIHSQGKYISDQKSAASHTLASRRSKATTGFEVVEAYSATCWLRALQWVVSQPKNHSIVWGVASNNNSFLNYPIHLFCNVILFRTIWSCVFTSNVACRQNLTYSLDLNSPPLSDRKHLSFWPNWFSTMAS